MLFTSLDRVHSQYSDYSGGSAIALQPAAGKRRWTYLAVTGTENNIKRIDFVNGDLSIFVLLSHLFVRVLNDGLLAAVNFVLDELVRQHSLDCMAAECLRNFVNRFCDSVRL